MQNLFFYIMVRFVNIIWVVSVLAVSENAHHVAAFSRIIGGYITDIESFPFIVSLQSRGRHSCGGVIINPKFIVTAAHCINPSAAMSIKAGTDNLMRNGITVKVDDVKIHPKYDGPTKQFDVAILKLKQPLNYSSRIQNVKLPRYSSRIKINHGTAAGWGDTYNDMDDENLLRAVDLKVDRTCKNVAGVTITESMFCAGHFSGVKDTCKGDSGGPFVKDGVLYGLVSFGSHTCAVGEPGVFTKIPYVVDWIEENTYIL